MRLHIIQENSAKCVVCTICICKHAKYVQYSDCTYISVIYLSILSMSIRSMIMHIRFLFTTGMH
jgi:hypothetical protein